jgi:hypothetical protein
MNDNVSGRENIRSHHNKKTVASAVEARHFLEKQEWQEWRMYRSVVAAPVPARI